MLGLIFRGALGTFLGLVISLGEARGNPWSSRAPLGDPRQEVGVAALGGKVYVIGGIRANVTTADTVEAYDPNTDTWVFVSPLPVGLHHSGAAALNGKIYVIGGFSNLAFTPVDLVFDFQRFAHLQIVFENNVIGVP